MKYFKMIKGTIRSEDITILNLYSTNLSDSKYMKQTLTDLKGEIDKSLLKFQHVPYWKSEQINMRIQR